MTTTTFATMRYELVQRWLPWLGFKSAASSVTSTTLVDVGRFKDTSTAGQALTGNEYIGRDILRQDLDSADRVHPAGTFAIATGTLTQLGSNWSDTTDLDYYIIGKLPWEVVFALGQRAFDELNQLDFGPLTILADGDMETSGVTNWTATNATRTKDTTAIYAYSGVNTLKVTTSAANGYVLGATFYPLPGTSVYAGVVSACTAGDTARAVFYDVTHGTEFGEVVTHSRERPMYMLLSGSVPSGCTEATVKLGGVGNGDIIYFDSVVGPWTTSDMIMNAPSGMDQDWRFRKLREATFLRGDTSSNVWDASSRVFFDWKKGADFSLLPYHGATNPYQVQLTRQPSSNGLWVEYFRRASDFTTLADTAAGESISTKLPKELVLAKWAVLICEAVLGLDDKDPDALASLPRCQRELDYWLNKVDQETQEEPAMTGRVMRPVRAG